MYPLYNTASNNVFYYHNTISLDNPLSTSNLPSAGFYQTTLATGIIFKNNLITVNRGGNGAKHAIYLATTTSEVDANNNDYYVTGTNTFTGFFTTNRLTLADWVAASGGDANSVSMNPLYLDSANGNYKPQLAQLDNKGTGVGITTDILNITRNTTTPDIGAYEFAPVPCQNPPTPGTATVTPSSGICLEAPVALNITGHSALGSITFQWQASPDGVTGWTNISPVQYFPQFNTVTSVNRFYRAAVTCNTTTVLTNVVSVTLNNLLLAGNYTIDPAGPAGGNNFQSFQAAVTALLCGITGSVVFDVEPGNYTEQIRIPYIPGTSNSSTVTFRSRTGVASSVNLLFNGTSVNNYTLRLDSTKNFIFKNMSFTASNVAFGRVIELLNGAANDTIINCRVIAPAVTSTSNNTVGIYANTYRGNNLLIKGNTFTGGANAIYFSGTSAVNLTNTNILIDSNTVSGTYNHGLFVQFTKNMKVTNNKIALTGVIAGNTAGLYTNYADTAFRFTGNSVTINSVTSTPTYGVYVLNSRSLLNDSSILAGNKVTADSLNTGTIYGLTITASKGIMALNNVIAISSAGPTTYGLYNLNNLDLINYYNNSVNIQAQSLNGYPLYYTQAVNGLFNFRNNIFSNKGGGRAMFVNNPNFFNSDYNTLYTSGASLVQTATAAPNNFANLPAFIAAYNSDRFSIVYNPAFVAPTNLVPDVTSPDAWAIHGRGVQIVGNSYDFNNNPRPVTLLQGVPDMGAYEFFPSSLPTVLTATPANPAAGIEQTFMYGTDTVMKIKWGASAPPSIQMRRYSGVVPTGLAAVPLDSMFFYTKADIPGGGNYDYDAKLFYIDPWLGSITNAFQLGLGKTTASNAWVVGFTSRNDVPKRMIYQTGVSFIDKFTGLINPYAPPVIPDKDSSNRGRRFWVAYSINQLNANASQQMVLYLSAQEAANVQVKINGTNWVRNYFVQPNSVTATEFLPKAGADNAFLNAAGLFDRGISITSDVPIVAYAHTIGNTSSGATMLMPVGVWGYEYKTLGITQDYGANSFAYYYVIADNDNTRVEITSTPGIALQNAGMTPGVPYIVNLNKGQVFQVVASSQTQELSGSTIKSIPNAQGKCFPIASFSGSSRTGINCPTGAGSGGDHIMQQNFPSTAWGKRYLTAPSSSSTAATLLQNNIYRVAVKDPSTIVKRNGVTMTGLQQNFYYQYNSATADYIEADKPIMVAQFLTAGGCPGSGVGDPEMMYISPIEQGIDKIGFYRNDDESIQVSYLTLIVPTAGLPSLTIVDGNTTVAPDFVYAHPQNGILPVNYSVVIKRWAAAKQQVRVQSDSAFTAITYGLGSVESYGYNAGTLVKSLVASGSITNTLNPTGQTSEFTCAGAPFRFSVTIPLVPTTLTWKFSQVPNLTPNLDVTWTNPIPDDTIYIANNAYYVFNLTQDYVFSSAGLYPVQVTYSHPSIESCDKTNTDIIYVQVIPSPKSYFTVNFSGCVGDIAQFRADSTTQNGVNINQWQWKFHDLTTATGAIANYTYTTAGTFNEQLRTITADGCIGDTARLIVVNPRPLANVVVDSIAVCSGADTTFRIANPVAGVTYNWYNVATGGIPIATGTSFTVTNITAPASYYVEGIALGCATSVRTRVQVAVFSALPLPVVTVTSSTANSVTFTWTAVPGASSYLVSLNSGPFVTPSSGATGLTHTASALGTLTSASLVVRAVGAVGCQNSTSLPVSGCTNSSAQATPLTQAVCSGTNATFNVVSPEAGITYTWFSTATGGTALGTGTSFTANNITATTDFYVEQSSAASGCTGTVRTKVTVTVLQQLAPVVATVQSATVNSITFVWTAAPGAATYEVSTNGGTTWITPSSGPSGLTHTVTGLAPLAQSTLLVRAIGSITCQTSVSLPVTGRTLPDDLYIPNSFTPNGDGLNDVLLVYGYTIKSMQFMVFNQWGQKIFESSNQSIGWNGTYKGKAQPSGVYIYVAKFTLLDGSVITRKGATNLIR